MAGLHIEHFRSSNYFAASKNTCIKSPSLLIRILIFRLQPVQWRFLPFDRLWTTLHNKVSAFLIYSAFGQVLTRTTAAFEDFLLNYKSTQTDLDLAATDAFQDLNIDGDATSDEYDFMDDVADGKAARHAGQHNEPKRKYMDMLQRVADRQIGEVTIELDDLDNVSKPSDLVF